MMDCKKALVECGGELEKAVDFLREKGLAKAAKKADRNASQGMIFSYIHNNAKLGVLLELNCETDFVARTEEFQHLGHEIAMHIAASNPTYIKPEEVPAEVVAHEIEVIKAQALEEGKPEKMLDKIAGPTDREISAILQKNYEKKGVSFKLGCKVTGLPQGAVEFEENGQQQRIDADYVLLSIGRRAVTTGFGLENLGVLVERGRIVVDDQGQTNVPGVYATGDVNGVWMLAHVAYRESEVVINNLLGKRDVMRYNAVPSVIYTNPEVGGVGETEESCKARGIEYKVASISMNYSGRYMAENAAGDGICKVIVDPVRNRLIGCHIIGSYASEIIIAAAMLIETEMKIEDIKEFIFPHPTVCEIIREAIFQL